LVVYAGWGARRGLSRRNRRGGGGRYPAVGSDRGEQRAVEVVLGLAVDQDVFGKMLERLAVARHRVLPVDSPVPLVVQQRLPARSLRRGAAGAERECSEEHHHEEEGAEFGHQKNGRGAEPRSVTIVRTVPDGLESMVSRL